MPPRYHPEALLSVMADHLAHMSHALVPADLATIFYALGVCPFPPFPPEPLCPKPLCPKPLCLKPLSP